MYDEDDVDDGVLLKGIIAILESPLDRCLAVLVVGVAMVPYIIWFCFPGTPLS